MSRSVDGLLGADGDGVTDVFADEQVALYRSQESLERLQSQFTSTISETKDAKSRSKLSASFFVLGIGSLLPFNALLSVLDYYRLVFPSLAIAQYVTSSYTFPLMMVGLTATAFPPSRRFRPLCIFLSYFTMLITSLLFPLLTTRDEAFLTKAEAESSSQLFAIVLLTATLGVSTVLGQSIFYGLVGLFPDPICTNAYNCGGAFASMISVTMRAISRIFFDDPVLTSPTSLNLGFNIFFYVCAAVCLSCALIFVWLHQYNLEFGTHVRSVWESRSGLVSKRSIGERLRITWSTLRDVATPASCQLVCFATTITFFPSIVTVMPVSIRSTASHLLRSWYPLLVVATFAVGDTAGRSFISGILAVKRPQLLPLLTIVRLVSIPVLIVLWTSNIPTTCAIIVLTVFVHGFANGFLMNMGFVVAPQLTSESQREAAGRLVFIMLNIGLFTGSSISWILHSLLQRVTTF